MKKTITIVTSIAIVALLIFVYARYFFVFAEGTQAGHLNTFQRKGYVFKTWEGILIQSGFRVNVESNVFEFSVENERVSKALLENAGKEMELHYKHYLGVLPWRGNTDYVVDSIYYINK